MTPEVFLPLQKQKNNEKSTSQQQHLTLTSPLPIPVTHPAASTVTLLLPGLGLFDESVQKMFERLLCLRNHIQAFF